MADFHLRQWLFGLLIECPMGKAVNDCPIEKYRGESVYEKMRIAYELPEEEVKSILIHHRKCLKNRESSMIKNQLSKVAMHTERVM
jgi:hypothetical protein